METPSAQPLDYAVPPPSRPVRPLALIGIAFSTVAAGILVGASTNAINGIVSPIYFMSVMGWVTDVWWQSILQGMLEGSVLGIVLSFIITLTIGIITRGTCTYKIGAWWLCRLLFAVYGLWVVGGLCGVGLAAMQPQFFQRTFFGVPDEHGQMLRYAWVGGSIWGAEFGGILAVIVGLVQFRIGWRRKLKQQVTEWGQSESYP